MTHTTLNEYTGKYIDHQRGTALILTLVMLTIMSLLGVLSLNTSDTELKISGNYRSQLNAFYAADRAVEYAMVNGNIYATLGGDASVIYNIAADTTHRLNLAINGGDLDRGSVRYIAAGALPPGSGSDPSYFQARYYLIDVTGGGPRGSSTRITTQVARIVPK